MKPSQQYWIGVLPIANSSPTTHMQPMHSSWIFAATKKLVCFGFVAEPSGRHTRHSSCLLSVRCCPLSPVRRLPGEFTNAASRNLLQSGKINQRTEASTSRESEWVHLCVCVAQQQLHSILVCQVYFWTSSLTPSPAPLAHRHQQRREPGDNSFTLPSSWAFFFWFSSLVSSPRCLSRHP